MRWQGRECDDTEYVIVAFGSSARIYGNGLKWREPKG